MTSENSQSPIVSPPVKLAAETLSKDFEKVMHYKPVISQTIDEANSIDIVIINEETGGSLLQQALHIRPVHSE